MTLFGDLPHKNNNNNNIDSKTSTNAQHQKKVKDILENAVHLSFNQS